MLEMGLATCCLLCDAPDDIGSQRCKTCIGLHKEMRERIAELPQESLASQWGRELLHMLAKPGSYEHHESHGPHMEVYSSLLHGPASKQRTITEEDVKAAFAAARAKRKVNPLRDIANQSPWRDGEPSDEELARLSAELPTDIVDASGVRTVPSREIRKVDVSDRSGEDHELSARVSANAAQQDAPEDLRDVLIDLEVGEKRAERKQWSDLVEDLGDLLDED
jgi:hypothetical protein